MAGSIRLGILDLRALPSQNPIKVTFNQLPSEKMAKHKKATKISMRIGYYLSMLNCSGRLVKSIRCLFAVDD